MHIESSKIVAKISTETFKDRFYILVKAYSLGDGSYVCERGYGQIMDFITEKEYDELHENYKRHQKGLKPNKK